MKEKMQLATFWILGLAISAWATWIALAGYP